MDLNLISCLNCGSPILAPNKDIEVQIPTLYYRCDNCKSQGVIEGICIGLKGKHLIKTFYLTSKKDSNNDSKEAQTYIRKCLSKNSKYKQ